MLEIHILPVLSDNYIHVIHDSDSGDTAAVDPALAEPVLSLLSRNNWRLTHLFNTHHHWDHVGGNLNLKAVTGCRILAGDYDQARIPGIDAALKDGDMIYLGRHPARILFVPGHTLGHIAYHFFEDDLLFCGDTLFVMGCGRLFEGTAEEMWHSLQKIKQLPPATKVYCTHEYTENNGRFAQAVEPNNPALQKKMKQVGVLRGQNQPTVPSTIAEELATNPFFREDSLEIQGNLHAVGEPPLAIFARLRKLKDQF